MFQTKVVEKNNTHTHVIFNKFLPKIVQFINVKYGTAGQATDDNIIRRMSFAF